VALRKRFGPRPSDFPDRSVWESANHSAVLHLPVGILGSGGPPAPSQSPGDPSRIAPAGNAEPAQGRVGISVVFDRREMREVSTEPRGVSLFFAGARGFGPSFSTLGGLGLGSRSGRACSLSLPLCSIAPSVLLDAGAEAHAAAGRSATSRGRTLPFFLTTTLPDARRVDGEKRASDSLSLHQGRTVEGLHKPLVAASRSRTPEKIWMRSRSPS